MVLMDYNPDAPALAAPTAVRLGDWPGTPVPGQRAIWPNDDGTLDLSGRVDLLDSPALTAAQRRGSRTNADLITLLGAVYAAIRRRMRMVARPQIILQRRVGQDWRDVDDPRHPALLALRRGNGALTARQSWMLIEEHKLAAGCAYWVKRRNRLGVPVEFEIWDPYRTAILRDKQTPWRAAAYKLYQPNGSTVTVAAQDVINFRHFVDPREPLLSLSPIGAVRVTLDTGTEAQRWNRTFFDNNAMPPAILSGEEVGPAELTRIEEKISRTHQGTDNAFKVLALEGNLKLVASPISHDDMQFLEQQQWTVEEVARVMELSSISLNDLRHGTYSNYDQAQISDWTAVQDQVDCTLEELNEFYIMPDFGDDLRLIARYDGIPALQTDRLKQAQVDEIHLRTGKNVINEVRERDGEEPVSWGDTPLIAATLKPLQLGPDGKPAPPEPEPSATGGKADEPPTGEKPPRALSSPVDEEAARTLAELRADPDVARQIAETVLAEAGEGLAEVFRRSVEAGEARLLDEAARMLRLEMRLLFEYLDGLEPLTAEASAGHDWRGWYERNHGDLAAGIARVFVATLQEAGYPAGTLVSAKDLAVRYASARAGELLRLDTAESISVGTRARVRELVARTLEEGQSLRWLKNELRGDGLSFGDARAERIARTETAVAQGEGKLESFVQIGYEGKRWVTSGACDHEQCLNNQRAGAIRLAQVFPSGHRTVPAHPNCLCTILPVNHLDDPSPVALM